MPDLQIPPHPTHDYRCDHCKYWFHIAGGNVGYLQTPGGIQMVPLTELMKQGQSIAGMITARVAPCTKNPKWETTPKQHWCWQFESAGKTKDVPEGGEKPDEPEYSFSPENCPGHLASIDNKGRCGRCGTPIA